MFLKRELLGLVTGLTQVITWPRYAQAAQQPKLNENLLQFKGFCVFFSKVCVQIILNLHFSSNRLLTAIRRDCYIKL